MKCKHSRQHSKTHKPQVYEIWSNVYRASRPNLVSLDRVVKGRDVPEIYGVAQSIR